MVWRVNNQTPTTLWDMNRPQPSDSLLAHIFWSCQWKEALPANLKVLSNSRTCWQRRRDWKNLETLPTRVCRLSLITSDSFGNSVTWYCCGSVWETQTDSDESQPVSSVCVHNSLPSSTSRRACPPADSTGFMSRPSPLWFTSQQLFPVLNRRAGRREREQQEWKEESRSEWVFWVCLEKRDWDEARACALTSMDCSLGNMPATCVCVCMWALFQAVLTWINRVCICSCVSEKNYL